MNNTQHRPLRLPRNRDRIIARAVATDDACVSVGGLAARFNMLGGSDTSYEAGPGVAAIAKLVSMSRHEARLSPERFAAKIGLDVSELGELEAGSSTPEPRVLYQLSVSLRLSYHKLLVLAGHRTERIDVLEREKVRFAASSGPLDKLSKEDCQALHDFIRALSD